MPPTRRDFLGIAALAGVAPSANLVGGTVGVRVLSRLQVRRPTEATLALVGDLFLTDPFPRPLEAGTEQLFEVLRAADGAVANLENGLSTTGSAELGGFRYGGAIRGPPELVAELRRAGVTAVSLANNHTGNYGPDALLETMDTLDRAGIHHAGAGSDLEDAFAPVLFDANGLQIALLSVYSYYYNFGAEDNAGPNRPGIAASRAYDVALGIAGAFDTSKRDEPPFLVEPDAGATLTVMATLREDLDRMSAAIEGAHRVSDLTILSAHMHWGRHTRQDLPYQQRVLARAAVDAGADVFVGHGPHTVRGIEIYRGKPIFYSLGNFVLRPGADPAGAPPDADRRAGGQEAVIARIIIGSVGAIAAVELVPIVIAGNGQPVAARGDIAERILANVAGLSAQFGTWVEQREWTATVHL